LAGSLAEGCAAGLVGAGERRDLVADAATAAIGDEGDAERAGSGHRRLRVEEVDGRAGPDVDWGAESGAAVVGLDDVGVLVAALLVEQDHVLRVRHEYVGAEVR